MTRISEILSSVVAHLREARARGEKPSALVRHYTQAGMTPNAARRHFEAAFLVSLPSFLYLAWDATDAEGIASFDEVLEPPIDSARERWSVAAPYPDLYRRRDRDAFRALAKATQATVIVQAIDPAASRYVGLAGHRPFPLPFLGWTSRVPAHAGLIAADSADRQLRARLQQLRPALSHREYLDVLERHGLVVASEDEGSLVLDAEGNRHYPGYRVIGAYREATGMPVWTGEDGDRLRRELNLHMGIDLVQYGPLDQWQGREALEPGNPLRGPHLPAIFFGADGNVTVIDDVESMAIEYRALKVDWTALHPAVTPSASDGEG